jgi:hypothetical protein
MRFAAAIASLAQAIWDTYLNKCDVSNGSVIDGHFDWATPDVRAPRRSWPLAFNALSSKKKAAIQRPQVGGSAPLKMTARNYSGADKPLRRCDARHFGSHDTCFELQDQPQNAVTNSDNFATLAAIRLASSLTH